MYVCARFTVHLAWVYIRPPMKDLRSFFSCKSSFGFFNGYVSSANEQLAEGFLQLAVPVRLVHSAVL
jgi:hypothetical protein